MSAIISPCGNYRYRLERTVSPVGWATLAFFGVNPSTADATAEDATTRKWAGFCVAHECKGYIAGNAFAFRATDVKQLATAYDPVGPENIQHLDQIIRDADILVPCWGSRTKLPKYLRNNLLQLKNRLFASRKPVMIFGLTNSGDPKHPLMLGYKTRLVKWDVIERDEDGRPL